MVYFSSAALLLIAGGAEASFEAIAGYFPGSQVTDHNAIDLDQEEIELLLARGTDQSFQAARDIYNFGAHSKSVAVVQLTDPLPSSIKKGTAITGNGGIGQIAGKAYQDTDAGVDELIVQYKTSDIQSSYVGCTVGASESPVTEGCFYATGSLDIDGVGSVGYEYDVLEDNENKRTIAGFSRTAFDKQYDCEECPYLTYEKFYKYYGEFDYAHQWVEAAFDGKATSFDNGNADFSIYGIDGKKEVIKKGTAYMHIWMYVIREMEDALDDCKEGCALDGCNDDPVHAWDEGVAFYTGTLEGRDGLGSGKLFYALADKRCMNFKTCGINGDSIDGTSRVNIEVFQQFKRGLRSLEEGKCSATRPIKERIEQLMAVPLIQGTLRYAFFQESKGGGTEKDEAEGAVFAASVLPLVHACSEEDAEIIYDIMKVGSNENDFQAVKEAFERNYKCMGITCEDVGGLYDDALGVYEDGAAPCGGGGSGSSATSTGLGFMATLSVGAISAFSMLF